MLHRLTPSTLALDSTVSVTWVLSIAEAVGPEKWGHNDKKADCQDGIEHVLNRFM